MMKSLILLLFVGSTASATTLVECVDARGQLVLRLHVTGRRATYGVGGWWTMIHRGETYLSNERPATALTRRNGNVEITLTLGQTPSGPVGRRLILAHHPTNPTLSEWNFGGFTGTLKTGEFTCVRRTRYCGGLLGASAK